MAAATYTTDLTDLVADSASTNNWAATGGGASALNVETDYFIEGTRCISKNAWASDEKGMIEDTTNTTLSTGSGKAVYTWVTHLTPGSLGTKSVGGISILLGSSGTVYNEYDYAGSDTIDYGAPWICAVVNPDDATATTGTVTVANMDCYGAQANLPSGGPTKGAPFAIDEIRYGRSIEIDDGVGAQANFTDLAVQNDSINNRWGQFQRTPGSTTNFTMQCRLEFGKTTATSAACDFSDSGKNITIADLEHVGTGFIEFDITQASDVELISCNLVATAGGNTLGNWVTTSSTSVTLTSNSFVNMGTFGLDANTTATNCTWRNCALVTQSGATLTGCTFDQTSDTTKMLLVDDLDLVTGCTFVGDGTANPNHAVDLGTISTTQSLSWDNVLDDGSGLNTDWEGSAGTTVGVSGDADDAILVNVASGQTLTIATTSSSTIPSVRNTGAGTVTITANTVVVSVTVRDETATLLADAHVFLVKTSDYSTQVLNGATTGTGIVQDPAYDYTSDENVEGWVRQVDNIGTDYTPQNISGTIRSSGLQIEVQLEPIE